MISINCHNAKLDSVSMDKISFHNKELAIEGTPLCFKIVTTRNLVLNASYFENIASTCITLTATKFDIVKSNFTNKNI